MLGMFDNHVSTDLAADLLGHGSAWRGSLVGVLQDGVNHQHLICRWRSPSIPSSILLFVFVGTVGNDQVLRIHH